MDRISVSALNKPLVDAKGRTRDLRREESRMAAFVDNLVALRLYDLGRISDRTGLAEVTESEYEIKQGILALVLKIECISQPEVNGLHEAPAIEDSIKDVIDNLRGIPPRADDEARPENEAEAA